jgi:hypothetical protein
VRQVLKNSVLDKDALQRILESGALPVVNVPKLHTQREPRFRALLSEDGANRLVVVKR